MIGFDPDWWGSPINLTFLRKSAGQCDVIVMSTETRFSYHQKKAGFIWISMFSSEQIIVNDP